VIGVHITPNLALTIGVAGGAIAIAIGRDVLASSSPAETGLFTIGSYLLMLALALIIARRNHLGPRALGLGDQDVLVRVVGIVALSGIAIVPHVLRGQAPFLPLSTMALDVPVLVLAVIAEELMCRGTLLTLARRSMPPVLSVVLTAATFSAMHAARYTVPVLLLGFVAGALWGTWRTLTGDLVAPIAGHLVADLVAG
jgi:membrane protease YdiL (CAAX protease family)